MTNTKKKRLQEKEGYWRIEQMLDQLGARAGINPNNSLVYIGAHNIMGQCRDDYSLPDVPKFNEETGIVDFEVGLHITPNFDGGRIKFVVAVHPNDTYTLFITKNRKLLEEIDNLYCDNLADVVSSTYDKMIKELQGGFISI